MRPDGDEFFQTLLHNTADVILTLADDDTVRYANAAAGLLFGTGPVAGRRLPDLLLGADRAAATRLLYSIRRGAHDAGGADWRIRDPAGEIRYLVASCRDLRADPAVGSLLVILRDVTDQRLLELELTRTATHDRLTGLANRASFIESARLATARRRAANRVGAAFLIDLDDFKEVNDTIGHGAGDRLLGAVGRRLLAAVDTRGQVARLGGDEFAVLIEDLGDPVEVERVAEHLLAAVTGPVTVDGGPLTSTASMGVATTRDAGDSEDLLRQADLALNEVKRTGKGRWLRYRPALHDAIVERTTIRAELSHAVARGELMLRYQPIVKLDSGATVGFEALLRWQHPGLGVLSPVRFIDVAEESGLILPVGAWVLEQAITAAAGWQRLTDRPTSVTVNVSARQFRDPRFVEKVRDRLAAAGLPADRLVLEITESLLLRDDDQVWNDLSRLRDRGVRIAIDDFGTGYSSLSYLRQMPIDVVKLDKSFIRSVARSDQQEALVRGIVQLAHTLGLQVVAEGVEGRDERHALFAMGCRYAQGFHFARPMSNPDAERLLLREVQLGIHPADPAHPGLASSQAFAVA